MQNATEGRIAIERKARNEDRNDAYHSVVSDLASLIDHVQASLTLIESAIAREISVGSQEPSANIIVLDDVTPPYMRVTAALRACDANLALALHSLLDSKGSTHGYCGYAASAPALSILGG
jgi:hypothetical protein